MNAETLKFSVSPLSLEVFFSPFPLGSGDTQRRSRGGWFLRLIRLS